MLETVGAITISVLAILGLAVIIGGIVKLTE